MSDKVEQNSINNNFRDTLFNVANTFLLYPSLNVKKFRSMGDLEFVEFLSQSFQKNIECFYVSSGIKTRVKELALKYSGKNLDEQILNLVANISVPKSENVNWGLTTFPSWVKNNKSEGMECTLSSALLHCGLRDVGYDKVRTVVVYGHQLILRELSDGSIKFYDPSSTSTVNRKRIGFTHTFKPISVKFKKAINEGYNRYGYKFFIYTRDDISGTGLFNKSTFGISFKPFYAYSSDILIDLATALDNLQSFAQDARVSNNTTVKAILEKYKFISEIDTKKYIKAFSLFNKNKYINYNLRNLS